MRSRILATVRGDAARLAPGASDSPRVAAPPRRWTYALGLLAAAALGATATLVVVHAGSDEGRSSVQAGGPLAVLTRIGARAELAVSGMSEPPAGRVYELWTVRGRQSPRPTDALFTVTSSGRGTVEVPGSLHGVSSVIVTSEPRGGSSVPTGPTVLRVTLPNGH